MSYNLYKCHKPLEVFLVKYRTPKGTRTGTKDQESCTVPCPTWHTYKHTVFLHMTYVLASAFKNEGYIGLW